MEEKNQKPTHLPLRAGRTSGDMVECLRDVPGLDMRKGYRCRVVAKNLTIRHGKLRGNIVLRRFWIRIPYSYFKLKSDGSCTHFRNLTQDEKDAAAKRKADRLAASQAAAAKAVGRPEADEDPF